MIPGEGTKKKTPNNDLPADASRPLPGVIHRVKSFSGSAKDRERKFRSPAATCQEKPGPWRLAKKKKKYGRKRSQ